jgi:gliding motility-associated-like protein
VAVNVQRREIVITVADCGGFTTYAPDAGHDTVIYAGAHIQLHGADAASYNWSPGSFLDDSTLANPIGYFPTSGTYPFVLHGVSDSGCTGADTVHVIVLDHSTYAVPNAFSPNDDGHNDVLSPFNIEQATLVNFRIYDRWGKIVHDGSPFNAGWDGRYHGVLQQPGVYFWSLRYIDNHGSSQVAKGNVTLLR